MAALEELVGESPKIVALRKQVHALLERHSGVRRFPPILIQGETGTGKGLLARLMHHGGPRASRPFVEVNCAAIPETLLEAEMFGYERGAFTDARQPKQGLFQAASSGTLFLDEVGLLPRELQAKLLTAIEQGSVRRLGSTKNEPVDAAIIAATNADLLAAVRDGRFREDLYHRLAVLTIELPPLRDRDGDIELLADQLLPRICSDYGTPPKALSPDARAALRTYSWPGNVRELGNALERAALLSHTGTLTAEMLDLPGHIPIRVDLGPEKVRPAKGRDRLVEALEKTGWNITRTADMLGITRNTVRARIERYGLRPDTPSASVTEAATAAPDTTKRDPRTAGRDVAAPGVRWQSRRVTFLRAVIHREIDEASPSTTRALDVIVDKIGSFGGRVDEIGQHSVAATFGHEPAEDAPWRAAYAAMAITKAVERGWNAEQTSRCAPVGIQIHVARVPVARIGSAAQIDSDARQREWSVLERLGMPEQGDILVSDAAASLLARRFDMRSSGGAGSHRLLGREPYAASEEPRFVGRTHELEMLQRLFERTVAGHGQAVTVIGEPGIGKSRLVQEFREWVADRPASVLVGRCASYGVNVPYFPVNEMLTALCGIDDTDTSDSVAPKVLRALEAVGPAAVACAPYLQYLVHPRKVGALSRLSPEVIKTRTFEALQQLLIGRSDSTPLVLIVEDLHWIDKTSEELLASVAQSIAASPVLLLTTSRAGYRPPWMGRSHASQMALGPLSTDHSRLVIEPLLHGAPTDDALIVAILGRAEGNPFFLEELARAVRANEQTRSRMDIPGTVQDVLAARMDALADAEQNVLRVAAVCGRDATHALLQATCGVAPDDLRTSLDRLESAEFLYASGFGGSRAYSFKHALTLETAYASVPDDVRPTLHARVAASIERLAPETGERHPEILARHYAEAQRPTEAARYWHLAGRLAIQRSAHLDAIAHLTKAAELLDTQPPGAARDHRAALVQLALGSSFAATHGYGSLEVEAVLARARALVQRLPDLPDLAIVRWNLWMLYLSRADFRIAQQLAIELLQAAERQDDAMAKLNAHLAGGVNSFYLGELEAASDHLARAIRLYDRASAPSLIQVYGQDMGLAARGFLGWTLAVTGELTAAAQEAALAVTMAREVDHPFTSALVLLGAGEVHQLRREPAVVESLGQELLTVSKEHSFRFFTAFGLMFTGWARACSGDPHGGLALMREGAELFRSVGQRIGLAHRAHLADVLITAGLLDEGLAVVGDALHQSQHTGEAAFVSELHRLRGETLRRLHRAADAERSVREALAHATRQGAWLFALRAASDLVRLGAERGFTDAADVDTLRSIEKRFPAELDCPDVAAARALFGGEP